ncbi:MAG: protein kinase [Gemmatimonadetes bacterium]|nr:protein kinase [Gemmatimonadota bacterium]
MPDFAHRLQQLLAPRFQIERELGGGGMSRVFVATESALGRRVVIKVLPPELAAGVNVERFQREIQLAAQLQHPHIVPLLAAGEADGLLWFSMPYIEGESLRSPVARGERLPPRDVVRLLHDILEALAFAHERGVVHRDIKPGNILTIGRTALVTDFGIAKALSAAAPRPGTTVTGMAIGTPAYMAPEQLAADPAADHRADLYAVGLLAYELLTGRAPFEGRTPQDTLAAQLTRVPAAPHRVAPDVPPALSAVVMQCLEKDAARRPPSARDLLAALDQVEMAPGGAWSGSGMVRRLAALVAVAGTLALAIQVLRTPGEGTGRRARGAAVTPVARNPAPTLSPERPAAAPEPADPARGDVVLMTPFAAADSPGAEAVPVVISRAESLAIAAAVRGRSGAGAASAGSPGRPAGGVAGAPDTAALAVERAQLLEAVGRLFADSLAQALRRAGMDTASQRATRALPADTGAGRARITPLLAPQRDGRPRLVVLPYLNATGNRGWSAMARALVTALRQGVPAEQVMVVDSATTAQAVRDRRDPMSVGWSLRADYVVSGMVLARGDSVGLLTQFTDVRDGRFVRATEAVVAPTAPERGYASTLAQLRGWMDSAAVLRTRRPPPQARSGGRPGGPGGEPPPPGAIPPD